MLLAAVCRLPVVRRSRREAGFKDSIPVPKVVMKRFSGIVFPLAVSFMILSGAVAGIRCFGNNSPFPGETRMACADTVIYPYDGYKLHRKGHFEGAADDSLLALAQKGVSFVEDTIPVLSARDTIFPPDSLRETDPFRYKYYVALLDSATHVFVRDSLGESVSNFWKNLDTLRARADSADLFRLDSLYYADSTVRAKAAFMAWYASLDRDARRRYDMEQRALSKKAAADSLQKAREEAQALRDSTVRATPRILETFAFPDSMFYKRIVCWTVDQDFQKIRTFEKDTSFNHYINDYPFKRNDVGATWLGVAGSPVQTYDFFKRKSYSNIDFATVQEPWTFSPENLPMYNTKTPYTELAYWGTLFAGETKESNNIHLFTSQNILPELNLTLLFDRWGGHGILKREDTANKVAVASVNYTGKKYLLHVGFIHDRVTREENGGISDLSFVRDTTVDAREIPTFLNNASSEFKSNTVYLDQQWRIPFTFIEKIRARRDSTYIFNADSLNRNLTTAYIGHSSEYTAYRRHYLDEITSDVEKAYYHNVANFGDWKTDEVLGVGNLDNKVFIKLQPWSDDAVVSRINVGVGDRLRFYSMPGETMSSVSKTTTNSLYLYAGAEGRYKQYFSWDAKADFNVAGYNAADFGVSANAVFSFYPFRKARTSPLSLTAHFETGLRGPDYLQNHLKTNHFSWDNNFSKTSTTKVEGILDIPYWRMDARVGYAVVGNGIYYDSLSVIRQCPQPVNVVSASARKDFSIGGIVHLDNRVLFQMSSNQEVLPLPLLSLNMRYYVEFVAARHRETREKVLTMQIGANAWWNTSWNAPGWNPALGVFYNQAVGRYNNGPVIDVFLNMQWKKACIFVKVENIGMGWPMRTFDYFSAHGFINTTRSFKIGIFWPFYIQPGKAGKHSHDAAGSQGAGSSDSGTSGSRSTRGPKNNNLRTSGL